MRNLLTAATLIGTLGFSSAAFAGGRYVGLGVGGAASIDPEFGGGAESGIGMSGRLTIGQRFGRFGLEATLGRYGIGRDEETKTFDATTLAAGAKVGIPVHAKLNATLRGGFERTWLAAEGNREDAQGDGWYAGLGIEYPIDLGVAEGALFLDVTRHQADTDRGQADQQLTSDMWAVGMQVGF